MDCGGLISRPTALKGGGRCRSCSRKGNLSWNKRFGLLHRGKNHHGWKGGWKNNLPNCIDCGKKLSYNKSVRCKKCNAKFLAKKGKFNPMFGKKPKFYRFIYKNIKFRSSWEVLVAIWFDFSHIKWEYESKTFDLGNTTYTPDFYLPEFDCYIEIKGWWKKNFLTKLNKVKKKISIYVWKEQELYEFLGVSKFLLTKSRKSWLNKYLIS